MTKELRPRLATDHMNVNKAIDEIYETMNKSDIEITLWSPALIYVLISGYKNCGFTYEEFRLEMDMAFEHYKDIFDE
jgi:hypothetical protein